MIHVSGQGLLNEFFKQLKSFTTMDLVKTVFSAFFKAQQEVKKELQVASNDVKPLLEEELENLRKIALLANEKAREENLIS